MQDLDGRVGVVTGAASGIGRGIARAFASAGMRLVVADIEAAPLEATAAELRALGVPARAVVTDVRDETAVEALAEATTDEYGAVHVVCNNAGVWTVGYQWETDLADWRWVLDVNLWGVIHGIRSFAPRLLAQPEGGHIVNTASMGGLIAGPLIGPYTATKHAVVGLSKGLRAEMALQGAPVGVSVLCPGEIATGLVHKVGARPGKTTTEGPGRAPEVEATLAALREGDRAGMSPDDAGRMVLDAVRQNRFWILPNAAPHLVRARRETAELFATGQEAG